MLACSPVRPYTLGKRWGLLLSIRLTDEVRYLMDQAPKGGTGAAVLDWSELRPRLTRSLLRQITNRIVQEFGPRKVVLFGSHAYGAPGVHSDVDLLVIMDSDEPMAKRMSKVAAAAQVPFLPMDVLVYTPDEIEDRLVKKDFFVDEILTKGEVLYEDESG